MNDGGPAYPYRNEYGFNEGKSLRDHFAGLAMQAEIPHWYGTSDKGIDEYAAVACAAYRQADAMLAERARREEKT